MLCNDCSLNGRAESECSRNHIIHQALLEDPEWARVNKALCDLIHRGIDPPPGFHVDQAAGDAELGDAYFPPVVDYFDVVEPVGAG